MMWSEISYTFPLGSRTLVLDKSLKSLDWKEAVRENIYSKNF